MKKSLLILMTCAMAMGLYAKSVPAGNCLTTCHSTGRSASCLRNMAFSTVRTNEVFDVFHNEATCGGEVLDDGGLDVIAYGVCWSKTHNPTVADAHTIDGTGMGEFTSVLTNLSPGTVYYVRAYATNSAGTSYGEEVSFLTLCLPEDQCELTFVLTDSYGDGWDGSAIKVIDVETGILVATLANENRDGNYGEEIEILPLTVCNGRTIKFEWVSGAWDREASYTVYDGQGEVIFSGEGGFSTPVSYVVQCCDKIALDESNNYTYFENFDSYTSLTTTTTGVEPTCWELVQSDVQMTDANRPQLYYKSSYAHSGSYSLLLNYRGVYAMPELSSETEIPLNRMKLGMYLRQPRAYYQLQVGVWEDGGVFVPVATFNNSNTGVEFVECDFSNYNGNSRRIAFRNVLANGYSYNYSYNYIDDITLTEIPSTECAVTLPYSENFDSYTASTTTTTGVEPVCWELVRMDVQTMTDANRPQIYYKSAYAHSGNYSLLLNYRGIYAMPELSDEIEIPLNQVKLEMYLRQPRTYYRLQVGVWEEDGTFVPVATFNNSSTDVEFVECDFSNYSGSSRRIAFRNVLANGYSYNYSYNYLDDITLVQIANKNAEVTDANAVDALAADCDQVDVVVYPNPTKDVVNVQCTMNNAQCSGIEVIDVYGKVVTTVVGANNDSPAQINVSDLAAGMYFVRVTTDKGVVTRPFVKR